MAATDTIVGITGAVLLAVVMVGVFVYEYNNAPVTDPDSPEGRLAHFRTDYPTLNATGDLNGNGVANYLDRDMDGDGTDNANDTATAVTRGFTGTMPAPSAGSQAAPPMEFKVRVEEGSIGAAFTLYYNSTTAAPLPGLPTLALELTGCEATASSPSRSTPPTGTTATTVTITTEALPVGECTLRVTQTVAGPSTDFAVKAFLDYGKGHPSEGSGFVKR